MCMHTHLIIFLFLFIQSYIDGYERGVGLAAELIANRKAFGELCASLRDSPEQRGRSLQALLVMPVQRMPRYRLLIEALRDATPPDHVDAASLRRAAALCVNILDGTNEKKRITESRERMMVLARKLDRGGEHLVLPHRRLLSELGFDAFYFIYFCFQYCMQKVFGFFFGALFSFTSFSSAVNFVFILVCCITI